MYPAFHHSDHSSEAHLGAADRVRRLRTEPNLIKRDTRQGRGESGQGLIEYALLAALIAIVLTLALLMFQDSVGKGVDTINAGLEESIDKPGGCLNDVPKLKNPNC